MSWFAILLALAALGGSRGDSPVRKFCAHASTAKQHQQCKRVKKKKPAAKPRPTSPSTPGAPGTPPPGGSDAPAATPTATPTPAATPTPTATPVYPRRTGVDLKEWSIRSSYRTLAAGTIDFNTANLGEDDHNLSLRGSGREYGRLDLAPGDADTLKLTLAAGTYTLYCSLPGHEAQGMRTEITVR